MPSPVPHYQLQIEVARRLRELDIKRMFMLNLSMQEDSWHTYRGTEQHVWCITRCYWMIDVLHAVSSFLSVSHVRFRFIRRRVSREEEYSVVISLWGQYVIHRPADHSSINFGCRARISFLGPAVRAPDTRRVSLPKQYSIRLKPKLGSVDSWHTSPLKWILPRYRLQFDCRTVCTVTRLGPISHVIRRYSFVCHCTVLHSSVYSTVQYSSQMSPDGPWRRTSILYYGGR